MKKRKNEKESFSLKKISFLVSFSYLVKGGVKIAAGTITGAQPLVFDGYHSIIDVFEHIGLRIAGKLARQRVTAHYPIGKRQIITIANVIIGLVMILISIELLKEIVSNIMFLLIENFQADLNVPAWLKSDIDMIDIQLPSAFFNVIAGIVSGLCAAASFYVYVIEYNFAVRTRMPELRTEAKELRNDGLLEAVLSLSFFTAAGIQAFHFSMSEWVNRFIIIAALSYIMLIIGKSAYSTVKNNLELLLNRAIPEEQREQLDRILKRDVPEGVSLCQNCPVTAFHISETFVFVKASVIIPSIYNSSTDMVKNRCRDIIASFFAESYEIIQVNIDFRMDYNRDLSEFYLLKDEWGIQNPGLYLPVIKKLRSSSFDEMEILLTEIEKKDKQASAEAFKAWARAWGALFSGQSSGIIIKRFDVLREKCEKFGPNARAQAAALIMQAVIQRAFDVSVEKPVLGAVTDSELCSIIEKTAENSGVSALGRAECYFAAGVYYQRRKSDVSAALAFYKKAEREYFNSGYREEIHRLYNSWGHLLTLLYRLSPAESMLRTSMEIKKRLEDNLGLEFSYGCLADYYSRVGEYEKAFEYYDLDIDMCEKAGRMDTANVVRPKKALAYYRRGFSLNDVNDLNKAFQLSESVERALAVNEKQALTVFYSKKEMLKCELAIQIMRRNIPAASMGRIPDLADSLQNDLRAFQTPGPYLEGLFMRLCGRRLFIEGLYEEAMRAYTDAAELFTRIEKHDAGRNVQIMICRLESAAVCFYTDGKKQMVMDAIEEMIAFAHSEGGYLDKAGHFIRGQSRAIRKYLHKSDQYRVLLESMRLAAFFEI